MCRMRISRTVFNCQWNERSIDFLPYSQTKSISCVHHVLFLKVHFDPWRAWQEMSSKIQENYRSINETRTQTLQVTTWPGPCKQFWALTGFWKGPSCKNNIKIMMFIKHPGSSMLQQSCFLSFRKGSRSLSESVIFPDTFIWLHFPMLYHHAKRNACQR